MKEKERVFAQLTSNSSKLVWFSGSWNVFPLISQLSLVWLFLLLSYWQFWRERMNQWMRKTIFEVANFWTCEFLKKLANKYSISLFFCVIKSSLIFNYSLNVSVAVSQFCFLFHLHCSPNNFSFIGFDLTQSVEWRTHRWLPKVLPDLHFDEPMTEINLEFISCSAWQGSKHNVVSFLLLKIAIKMKHLLTALDSVVYDQVIALFFYYHMSHLIFRLSLL